MDGDSIGLIIVMVILLALSAFFSATETAFSTFNRIRMKSMAQNGNKKAALVMKYDDKYDKMLNSVLIGNNIVNISLSSIATLFFVELFTRVDPSSAQSIGATVSTAIITVAVLVFGEIAPKIIAKSNADKIALSFVYIVNAVIVVLTPLSAVFGAWSKLVMKVFKSKDQNTVTEEEILAAVKEIYFSEEDMKE